MNESLKRALRSKDLVMIVVGTVIGSGIFIVPASVLRSTGEHVWLALLVWVIGGVLTLLGALSYAELGAMFPQTGGLYVYLRDAFGRFPAFLYGWALFFLIGTGATATLAVAFATYLQQLIPLSTILARIVSALMIVVVAVLNVRGVKQSAHVQGWATAVKVGAIVVMSGILITLGGGDPSEVPPAYRALSWTELIAGMGVAIVGVLWAYEGWHYVSFSTGETIAPQTTYARAIVVGSVAVVAIYLLANLGYIAALGPVRAAQSERIAAEAVSLILGPATANVITVAILVSIFSAANGIMLTATRAYYAMANDRIFFRVLGEVHPRFRTPAKAVVWSALWALLLAATGTFEQLFTYVVFGGWIFYALGAVSVIVFRSTRPELQRTFRVPAYPFTPIIFALASAAIVLNTLIVQPERGFVGLGILFLGAPAYAVWIRRAGKSS